MTEDDWIEILEEPPHGHNHGRRRTGGGAWSTLETDDPSSFKGYVEARNHGTRYTYQKIGCRCGLCTEWNRVRIAEWRKV